jgi:hypothetical protein
MLNSDGTIDVRYSDELFCNTLFPYNGQYTNQKELHEWKLLLNKYEFSLECKNNQRRLVINY